jgi:hypothetical protein
MLRSILQYSIAAAISLQTSSPFDFLRRIYLALRFADDVDWGT